MGFDHRRARLAERERDGGLRGECLQTGQHGLRRARLLEHRLRIVGADEEIAHGRQHFHEKVPGLLRRPQAGPVVDVEREGHVCRRRLAHRAPDHLAEILAEGGRDTGEVQEAGALQPPPVHVIRLQPAHGRVAPVVQDAHRAGRHAVLEEVEAHPDPLGPEDSRAVDAVTRELTHRTVRPGMRGRKRRDERGTQAEARACGSHVGLGATDLHVQGDGLLEPLGGRRGEPQHHLSQGDEVEAHRGGSGGGDEPDGEGAA